MWQVTGRDEEETLARLNAHRRELIDPKIADHRGRIVKTTGDGILIEFPSVLRARRHREQSLKNIARPVRVYRVQLGPPSSEKVRAALPLPDKPSIAVLPLANLSGDPGQDYFSDGITEDIHRAVAVL
jgi:class 3 adenylate cyclase